MYLWFSSGYRKWRLNALACINYWIFCSHIYVNGPQCNRNSNRCWRIEGTVAVYIILTAQVSDNSPSHLHRFDEIAWHSREWNHKIDNIVLDSSWGDARNDSNEWLLCDDASSLNAFASYILFNVIKCFFFSFTWI